LGPRSFVVKCSDVSVTGAAYMFGVTATSSQCWKWHGRKKYVG